MKQQPRLKTTQKTRVLAVLEAADKPLILGEIARAIWSRFRIRDSEAAISARVRELARSVDCTVIRHRVPKKQYLRYELATVAMRDSRAGR